MNGKYNQIVLVGHSLQKLIFSIDKEIMHKITFITEAKPLPGTPEAKKILKELIKYYRERKIVSLSSSFNVIYSLISNSCIIQK